MRCPKCGHANDVDFRFCQRCAYQRKVVNAYRESPSSHIINLEDIDARLHQLLMFGQATSYAKQKDSLKNELQKFLASLPGCPTMAIVTPVDICRFLVYKDKHGRTQVHCNSCQFLGERGMRDCGCPSRLSYNTVDSYIGKLRAIFHATGRDGEWDRRLCLGNPATDQQVKDYLLLVTAEQLQARIQPKQATPFFVDKLAQLTNHLETTLCSPRLTPTQKFIVARDQAYFKAVFFSGDRPGDMGQVKVPEILRFPNDDGFLFNHVWGKTLRDGHNNIFGIRRNPQTAICPVKGIEQYMAVARELKVDLTKGYLFRPTTPQGGVLDSPLTSSTAEARLKVYLKEMGADNGETLHGFRAGCAITLALSGVELSEIMDHVGWARRHTALYYLQLAKVLNPEGASAKLAEADLTSAITEWSNINDLKRFVCAFPADTSLKRLHPNH